MELPRRKLLIILTCPLPLILYLFCLLIAYHFVVPNHETDHKDHVATTVENIKTEQNSAERYDHNATESETFELLKNISMRTNLSNITTNKNDIKNQDQSRQQNTSLFLIKSAEMGD